MREIPGVVIAHSPAETGIYLQCPSIVILPDGTYVASHSLVGPGTTNTDSEIFQSKDGGASWERMAHLSGQVWSNLFLHHGSLYIMGTDHRNVADGRLNGRIVIRRSEDGGRTWTTPRDPSTGLLTDGEGWHTAPVPVAVHRGRLWRAFEFAPSPDRVTWRPLVLSAPEETDLLDRSNWTFSEQLHHDPSTGYRFIEGNVVVAPDDTLVNIVRANRGSSHGDEAGFVDKAILVRVAAGGEKLIHDPEADIIDFPGGGTKFTIRFDRQTGRYWSLVNPQKEPGVWRNVLALSSSTDLRTWRVETEVLRHPDAELHAFQYVDWVFDGNDIIYVSRTSFDDGTTRPKRVGSPSTRHYDAHDANYFTFHRIEGFRALLR